jgi:flagellar protein FliO/FliZ
MFALWGALPVARAAESHVYAASAVPNIPGAAGGTLRVVLALIVVLGAVFAAAWLSRRVNGMGRTRSGGLELISQLPLGPRERAVLIRVGSQQLLLGVTNGSVRTLHVLPPGSESDLADGTIANVISAAPPPSFKALLLKSLGK